MVCVAREILHKGTLSQENHSKTAPNDLPSSGYVFKVCFLCLKYMLSAYNSNYMYENAYHVHKKHHF